MQKFLTSEKKIIKNIITKIENLWFVRYDLSVDLPKDSRLTPWKYEPLVLQKLLCEQNGTFLQDNIKKFKYLDKWNSSLTLYESRIKLCNQSINLNFRNGQYIYETENSNQIFNDIGILSNILDKDINNTDFDFNEELAGGVHNLDMFTAMPIFWEGKLVAWAEVGGHQGDTGSITPGGFAPTAKSRYEEGFHMPAVRIGRNFELRRDILDYMGGTVRNPHVFIADLKSRTATLFQIRRRFLRELEKRGVEPVVGGMRKILIKGEENARIRLKEINDGIFRSILFNDEHGTFFGLTRVPVTVFKEDDELIVLVQGVSPENIDGPFNSSWHLTRAATAVYLFSYFFRGFLNLHCEQ